MIRATILVLLAVSSYGNEFNPTLWPVVDLPSHSLYTNAYAREIDAAVQRRSRWAGVTNWSSGLSTNGYLRHTNCESWSAQLLALLPLYQPTTYSRPSDYSFDVWFHEAQGSLSNDFPPRMTFPDVLAHAGIGLVVSQQVAHLAPGFDDWTVTNGVGMWTKRKNRHNPLIVREWCYNPESDAGWWSRGYRGEIGPDNEFSTGASFMPTIRAHQYPVFRYVCATTNGHYPGNVTFTPPRQDNVSAFAIYTNSAELPGDLFDYGPQLLSATNTRSLYPWVRFADACGMSSVGQPPGTNDRITLYYDQCVTTFSGSVVWDAVLLPEQLNEHRAFVTNMFLVPWDRTYWTNSIHYTNSYVHAYTNADLTADVLQADFFPVYSESTSGVILAATHPTPEGVAVTWWSVYCPWIDDFVYPSVIQPGTGSETNSQSPYFEYRFRALATYSQEFAAVADYCPGILSGFPPTNWEWNASVVAYGGIQITGVSVSSSLVIDSLYTGTPHRAHVYLRWPMDQYRRWGIFPPSGYTTAASITTDVVNVWSNMPGGSFDTGACEVRSGEATTYGSFVDSGPLITQWVVRAGPVYMIEAGWTEYPVYVKLSNSYYVCDGDITNVYIVQWISNNVHAAWERDDSDIWTNTIELYGVRAVECSGSLFGDEYTYWDGTFGDGVMYTEVLHYDEVEAMARQVHQVFEFSDENCPHSVLRYESTNVWNTVATNYVYGYSITGARFKEEVVTGYREKTLRYYIDTPLGVISERGYSQSRWQGPASTNELHRVEVGVKVLIEWQP